MSTRTRTMAIAVTEDEYQAIRRLAFDEETTVSSVLRVLIIEHPLFLRSVARKRSNGNLSGTNQHHAPEPPPEAA